MVVEANRDGFNLGETFTRGCMAGMNGLDGFIVEGGCIDG